MKYKSIILTLIEQNPQLHAELKSSRSLLATVEREARAFKDQHEGYLADLTNQAPEAAVGALSSQAFEVALADMESRLGMSGSCADEAAALG